MQGQLDAIKQKIIVVPKQKIRKQKILLQDSRLSMRNTTSCAKDAKLKDKYAQNVVKHARDARILAEKLHECAYNLSTTTRNKFLQ